MKKTLLVSLFLVLITISTYFFSNLHSSDNLIIDNQCAFCNQQVIDDQKFYEDNLVTALYSHKPIFPGHSLIIPKRHVERFELLSDEEIAHIGQVIKKVNSAVEKVFGTSSYILLQKNGKEVGQTVPHVHFHYIPRQLGDDSTLKFILKMYMANFGNPIESSEMKSSVEKLQEAMCNIN